MNFPKYMPKVCFSDNWIWIKVSEKRREGTNIQNGKPYNLKPMDLINYCSSTTLYISKVLEVFKMGIECHTLNDEKALKIP